MRRRLKEDVLSSELPPLIRQVVRVGMGNKPVFPGLTGVEIKFKIGQIEPILSLERDRFTHSSGRLFSGRCCLYTEQTCLYTA